ncbi:hypothetical protein [Rheinheimera sp. UJ63]|uniref:hypothetical protein n=1 Tax=Rheinheimera sp. UJ63 TaxID=2910157 RepID=UPI001F304CD4|nr:hypothetical protein [Rheinheimera sp. UJ63]MCF4010618.1 hypothetical protein [Rheinheimera sp. UJ63]
MRIFKKMIMAGLVSVLVVSCASTDSSKGTNGYPVLKILSSKPYVWDDSISEALNVARMAQPAGVGNGMKDFADGTEANTGRIGGGTRILDAGLGLLSQGVFGVISMEALNSGVNRKVDWKPSIVDFVPVKSIDELNRFSSIQKILSEKIKDSLAAEYPDLIWHGAYTLNDKRRSHLFNTDFLFFDKKACDESYKFSLSDKINANSGFNKIPQGTFFEDTSSIEEYCELGGLISIAGKTVIDGDEYYIIIFKVEFGHYFNEALSKHYDGYLIMPDYFNFVAIDKPVRINVNREYASVFKKGKELLFQR